MKEGDKVIIKDPYNWHGLTGMTGIVIAVSPAYSMFDPQAQWVTVKIGEQIVRYRSMELQNI